MDLEPNEENQEFLVILKTSEDQFLVSTMSSFFKPNFAGQCIEDGIQLITNWIHTGRMIAFRWPEENKTCWNSTNYLQSYNVKQHPIRTGKAVFFSKSVDLIAEQLSKYNTPRNGFQGYHKPIQINTSQVPDTADGGKKTTKRKLSYEMENCTSLTELVPMKSLLNSTLGNGSNRLTSSDYDELNKENQGLKGEIILLQGKISQMTDELIIAQSCNNNLLEKIKELEINQPTALIAEMKDHVLELREIVKSVKDMGPLGSITQSGSLVGSPSIRSSTQLVPLYGDIMISETAIRRVKVAARTDGNSATSINACVSIILDTLYHTEELANMSLSGLACPSIKGSVPKPKLPDNVRDAVRDYMIGLWDQIYKSILTEKQIRSAISAKFISCHSSFKTKSSSSKKKTTPKKKSPEKSNFDSRYDID